MSKINSYLKKCEDRFEEKVMAVERIARTPSKVRLDQISEYPSPATH